MLAASAVRAANFHVATLLVFCALVHGFITPADSLSSGMGGLTFTLIMLKREARWLRGGRSSVVEHRWL